MHTDRGLHEQLAFHLTGRRAGTGLEDSASLALRPALLAGFHDLTRLRYDFPVVLLEGAAGGDAFRSLTDLVNELLERIAPPGPAAERLRKSVLRLEREIRRLLAEGQGGRLAELWRSAAERIAAKGDAALRNDLDRAQAALHVDGELLDCGPGTAAGFATHAWRAVGDAKARGMRREIDALIVRLTGLVKADYLRSEAGRRAETLRAGIGAPQQGLFDFDAMARLLAKPSGGSALAEGRRRRIEGALAVLGAQRFFSAEGGYAYLYEDVQDALRAFRERLPAMAELVKAIAIAELEVDGRYAEGKHDEIFRGYGAASLGARDLALFPSYLACPRAGAAARATLIEALSSGAPLKILLETHDLLDRSPFGEDHASLGSQLAASAMGLAEVFVLQTASSNLYRARERLRGAMAFGGPALVSVYAGAADNALPSYLASAAAMHSRAFPAFSYDPSAGSDWAQRFSLEDNPQPERPWPVHEFTYADETLQRVREELPFTFADFAACDPRQARHFASVPREEWNGSLVPVGTWLEGRANGDAQRVPCVYAVDATQRLRKLVVDEMLVQAARRCAASWRRLQELDGLKRPSAPAAPAVPAAAAPAEPAAAASAPAAAEPAASERSPDQPYIETERCTTCNECTQINSALFAYDANKQAHIANPDAGTYRQLVEAAESCQVSIIHPGKPRNPKEPGLDELLKRAAPFL